MRTRLLTTAYLSLGAAAFLAIVLGLAVLAEWMVKSVHLALLYGLEPVASGHIYFEVTKPELIVSNGDRLPRFHLWCHTLSLVTLWLGSCSAVFLVARAFFKRPATSSPGT